jgi:2,3,4,5-tetrahydropyridine-2-carboxylate N-succinyltransferase
LHSSKGPTLPIAAEQLEKQIEALFDAKPVRYSAEDRSLFATFKEELNGGRIRSAEPDSSQPTGWRTNAWVKKGILVGFRMGAIVDMSIDPAKQPFLDKDTYPVRGFSAGDGVRIVPGGSSIRDGCFIGRDVGSCAQIGRQCHISAAAQIGGVLEPVGAMPVIIEDEVLVGGNCGVYEGTIVKRRAVLGTGTSLNRSTPVYDIVHGKVYAASDAEPLVIPEEAVVVAGSRSVARGVGRDWGISLYTPVIVKYRDSKTEAKLRLEDLLR